jgi:hypothetical protein
VEETSFLFIAYIIFFMGSSVFRKRMILTTKSGLLFWIPAYLLSAYTYLELLNKFHHILRNSGIYLEFGHTSIVLLGLDLLCFLTVIVFMISIFIIRMRNNPSP